MTWREIIQAALLEIGAIASGEPMKAEEAADGLDSLNMMIDSWSAERLMLHEVKKTTWSITSGTGTYSVGSGSDVSVMRPVFVDRVSYYDSSLTTPPELQLVKLTTDEWTMLSPKTYESVYPTHAHYEPTDTTGTLYLWPIPTHATLVGVLYAPSEPIAQATSLSATPYLPPGYRLALVKSLAVQIGPQYDRATDQGLRDEAMKARAVIKRANRHPVELKADQSAPGLSRSLHSFRHIYSGP
jgi:hypothetical protein